MIDDPHLAAPLYERALAFADAVEAPFYCPGHKGGRTLPDAFVERVVDLDLNNLPETDTLHCPTGPILEAEVLLARAYGVASSFFLVGGSTAGNTAAIMAVARPGDTVLIQRNVHKSVVAGLVHTGAHPVWLPPVWDADFGLGHCVALSTVDAALKRNPEARAVVALNPTYYGTVGDIRGLADRCKAADIPLLVDEAHGPHFHFHTGLPMAAASAGADLVIQSTHKVLSGLSQAAVLHLCSARVTVPTIRKMLQLIQTTSPNFAIMASIDIARRQMVLEGHARVDSLLFLASDARRRVSAIDGLRVLEPPDQPAPGAGFSNLDPTKIVIDVGGTGLSGHQVQRLLNSEHNVQPELAGPSHILCILTVGSIQLDVDRLVAALERIVRSAPMRRKRAIEPDAGYLVAMTPDTVMSPRDAFYAHTEHVPLAEACNRVAAEVVTPYPPGMPVLVPGERVTADIIEFLERLRGTGCPVSMSARDVETLQVVR
jgi:arginine decarboxylase